MTFRSQTTPIHKAVGVHNRSKSNIIRLLELANRTDSKPWSPASTTAHGTARLNSVKLFREQVRARVYWNASKSRRRTRLQSCSLRKCLGYPTFDRSRYLIEDSLYFFMVNAISEVEPSTKCSISATKKSGPPKIRFR